MEEDAEVHLPRSGFPPPTRDVVARIEGVSKEYEVGDAIVYALRGSQSRNPGGAVCGTAGAQRIRQDNPAEHDRRSGRADPRADLGWRQRNYRPGRGILDFVPPQQRGVRLPVLQPRSVAHCRRECGDGSGADGEQAQCHPCIEVRRPGRAH